MRYYRQKKLRSSTLSQALRRYFMKTQRFGIAFLVLVMLIASTIPAFAAPNLAIKSSRLIRGQWNQITFTARPKAGETLTSFTFSSELPFGGSIPAGCRRMNVPTRSVTCYIQPGVMSITIQLFVQQYETKETNSFFLRTWYSDASGAVSETNVTKMVNIRNR